MTDFPSCFDSPEQFYLWLRTAELAGLAHFVNPAEKYCLDCTPEYQREMMGEGRCRHSNVRFVHIDGGVEGRIRGKENNEKGEVYSQTRDVV